MGEEFDAGCEGGLREPAGAANAGRSSNAGSGGEENEVCVELDSWGGLGERVASNRQAEEDNDWIWKLVEACFPRCRQKTEEMPLDLERGPFHHCCVWVNLGGLVEAEFLRCRSTMDENRRDAVGFGRGPFRRFIEFFSPYNHQRHHSTRTSKHATAQKHLFFTILNSHLTLRSPAGWLFENHGHFFFSVANRRESTHGYLEDDPNPHPIPTTGRIISGSTALKQVQPPFNFYWWSWEPTFEGVDGLLRSGNIPWGLQYAVGNNQCSATKGLDELRKLMNHKRNVLWRLVIVSPDRKAAEYLRDGQNLTGEWADTPVYAWELPFGTFSEDEMQQLQANWDEVSTYSD